MENDLERSFVESLDGRDPRLAPHLPYLLQDLWEIGSSADEILALLREHAPEVEFEVEVEVAVEVEVGVEVEPTWRVLDLGCGKGAVSIPLARELGVTIHGIDGCADFIADAERYAAMHGVAHRCRFEQGDIRLRVDDLQDKGYDLVILGSIGPVLGDISETLRRVRGCLAPKRFVLLDDGYTLEGKTRPDIPSRAEAHRQIAAAGMSIRAERIMAPSDIAASNAEIFCAIERRADELSERHPELAPIFESYVSDQAAENEVLENEVACVAWLLQKEDV